MPTKKRRFNLSIPSGLDEILQRLAARDEQSVSTKALELLMRAIEWDEDEKLLAIVQTREQKKSKYIAHETAWS